MLVVSTAHLTGKFEFFASFIRNNTPNKPLPLIDIEFTIGANPKLEATLVPVDANQIVGYFFNGFKHDRVRAESLGDRSFLPNLKLPLEKLKKGSAPFGDPRPQVLRAFEASSLESLNETFQRACWWLSHGLSGEAHQIYFAEYRELQQALCFMEPLGVVVPDPHKQVPEEWEKPDLIGRKVSEFLTYHEAEFQTPLQLLTNNPNARLSWASYPDDQTDLRSKWVNLWQKHYGGMWGPFEC